MNAGYLRKEQVTDTEEDTPHPLVDREWRCRERLATELNNNNLHTNITINALTITDFKPGGGRGLRH